MREINGMRGGGQILRTALSLSAITGDNFRIENIRGSRSQPGLKRQHLKCVETVARLCDAKLEGAEIGSETLEFKPGNLRNESFSVNIGTAGSMTLLLDAVLPIATQFDEEFRLNVNGGTDVKWSPPFRSFRKKIGLLNRFGAEFDTELLKTGYYPKGGGEVRFESGNSSMNEIQLLNRGRLKNAEIYSKASEDLEANDVAARQADELERRLKNSKPDLEVSKQIEYVESESAGSTLVLEAGYENSVAVFDCLGEKGRRSEQIASDVFQQFSDFQTTDAAVDSRLADQLMIFVALVGGSVRVPEITDHIQTNLETIRTFDFDLELNGKIIEKR